jgi:hypothetical protein
MDLRFLGASFSKFSRDWFYIFQKDRSLSISGVRVAAIYCILRIMLPRVTPPRVSIAHDSSRRKNLIGLGSVRYGLVDPCYFFDLPNREIKPPARKRPPDRPSLAVAPQSPHALEYIYSFWKALERFCRNHGEETANAINFPSVADPGCFEAGSPGACFGEISC